MGEHGNRIFGAAIVLIGLLMLMGELVSDALRLIWPIALAVAGAAVLASYRRRPDDSGKVFTGTTLLLIGLFLLLVVRDWVSIKGHWPFFVAAPGIGLLAMARVDARRRDAMVPGWMAIGAAAVLYFFTLGLFVDLLEIVFELLALVLKVLVPLGLIGLGAWMLFHQNQKKEKAEDVPEKVEPTAPWGAAAAATAAAHTGQDEAEDSDADAGEDSNASPEDDAQGSPEDAEPWVTPAPGADDGPHPPIEDAEIEEPGPDETPVEEPGTEGPPAEEPDPDAPPAGDPEEDPTRRTD